MDFNRLLHDHQIALMDAVKSGSVDDERDRAEAVHYHWKLIEAVRIKSGAIGYPEFTNPSPDLAANLNKG